MGDLVSDVFFIVVVVVIVVENKPFRYMRMLSANPALVSVVCEILARVSAA